MMSRIINRNTSRIITQHLLKGGSVGLLARPTSSHLSTTCHKSCLSTIPTITSCSSIRRFYTMSPSQSSSKRETPWFDVEVPKYQSLGKREIETDVCVIGGGIAGVTSAYLLAKEGKKVTIIEARGIGSGETGRTSAHLMSAIDDRFFAIGDLHGKDASKIVADSHKEAINIIESIAKQENIDCDFKRVEGYLIPHDKKDGVNIVKKEADYANEVFGGVKLVESAPMGGYFTGPCALFPNQGQFHPMKYLVGVVKAFEKLGGVIYTGDIVTDALSGSSSQPLVKTDKGGKIKCKDVVIATCHPSFAGLPTLLKEEPFRTYMIAGRVPKGSVPNVLIWNTADPYIYARITPCDDAHDYLLVGGQDHPVGHMTDPKDPKKPIRELEQWAKQHYPMLLDEKLAFEWSGEVWEPVDMVGIIGRDPKSPEHVFIISGDSGTGLTHSSLGAKLTTDLIMGRKNEWEKGIILAASLLWER